MTIPELFQLIPELEQMSRLDRSSQLIQIRDLLIGLLFDWDEGFPRCIEVEEYVSKNRYKEKP